MRIVRATMEDVAAVLALEREAFDAPHWSERDYRVAVDGDLHRSGGHLRRCLFVAREGDEEAGLVGAAVGRVVAEVGEIESVAVLASARRQGVGRALCVAVIDWAVELGAEVMELEVRAGSAGAQALYGQLGFVACGRRTAYYSNPPEDAVLMRRLTPATSAGAVL